MQKKIFTVGFEIPGGDIELLPFRSHQSLLDADIIVFDPSFLSEYSSFESHQGKRLLTEEDSFNVAEDISHWRTEMVTAVNAGKTVFVFLSKFEEVFKHTGKKDHSGSGANKPIINYIDPFNNYLSLPVKLDRIVPKGGREILITKSLSCLSTYWEEFKSYSSYEVYLEGEFSQVTLTTKTGSKAVGLMIASGKGTLVLLPSLKYPVDEFRTKRGQNWNDKGIQFGKRLVSALVEIDKVLHSNRNATPAPIWANGAQYRLEAESICEQNIKDVSQKIEELQTERGQLSAELASEGGLRRLLFEKGLQLEEAILEALRIMGFEADNYKDSESEFDAVFFSEEGRFLGEAEGKDNKAVNIDKLRQLESNIQEDYEREEISEHAKGVLFGNAHRLIPPAERTEDFTVKCVNGAQRSKVALVRTADLFAISKYLKVSKDSAFAKSCRQAILQAEGCIVQFPEVPTDEDTAIEIDDEI